MSCRININNLQVDDRTEYVYFATHDFIVYQEGMSMVLASCGGDKLSTVRSSYDFTNHELLDMGDLILFVFDHKQLVALDKNGMQPISYELDRRNVGQCITKMFPSNNPNQVIFGTKLHDRIQFLNFDFIEQRRIAQTSSWEVSNITDFTVLDTMVYATLDNSFLVCCDMSTGETLWTRFETAHIGRGIGLYGDKLFYVSQGLLKETDGKKTEFTRIPMVKVHSIEGQDARYIYLTSKEGKNIIQYDLDLNKANWEVFGSEPIQETVTVSGVTNKDRFMFIRTPNNVNVVNLMTGKAVANVKTKQTRRLRITGDHIIIQKEKGTTTLIPGLHDESND